MSEVCMFGKTRILGARPVGSGQLLPGRGRTFADFLRPGARAAAEPTVAFFEFPYRERIEAHLGRPFGARARVDAAGCAARGVLAYLDGDVVCFASASPAFAEALQAAMALLGG